MARYRIAPRSDYAFKTQYWVVQKKGWVFWNDFLLWNSWEGGCARRFITAGGARDALMEALGQHWDDEGPIEIEV